MKIIKIFVASSEELRPERLALAEMVGHLNYILSKIGMMILLVKWEYLDASMNPLDKQEEYNQELKDCEICMVLYWTRFGTYTKIELDTAYQELRAGNNPRKLYVYFKDSEQPLTQELIEFKNSFPSLYGHFFCAFKNEDALRSHLLLQFMDYQNSIHDNSLTEVIKISDSKVNVAGRDFINLNKLDFAGNNEEYQQLLDFIEETRSRLECLEPASSEYSKYAQKLQKLIERRQEKEDSMWQTALTITRLSNETSSERLRKAIELFNKGDNRGTNAILNEEDIYRDIDRNRSCIELCREGLKNNIAELTLKLDVLSNVRSQGWIKQSGKIREDISSLTKDIYGFDSEEYAESLLKNGLFYYNWCKYSNALSNSEKALQIFSMLFGEEHLGVAACYNIIGLIHRELNNCGEALETLNKALDIRQKFLGEEHPAVATCYNNIGLVYNTQGNYTEALNNYRRALNIDRKFWGEDNVQVITSYNNIGTAYAAEGDYTHALEYYNKALSKLLALYGEKHQYVSSTYNSIGIVYECQGNYTQAYECYEKSLNINLIISGEEHSDIALNYSSIGGIYNYKGNCDKALEYYEKALRIRKIVFGERHPAVGSSYNDIGLIYNKQRKYAKALECFKNDLSILIEKFGEKHPDVATSYDNIGLVYDCQKKYERALEYYEKALNIRLEIFKDANPDIAISYGNIGLVYESQKKYGIALEYFEKALDIRLVIFGAESSKVAFSYYIIGRVYESQKKYEKALEYYEKALNIRLKIFGEGHPLVRKLIDYIKDIKRKLR